MFVFFTIVEFALVLLVHENALRQTKPTKRESESETMISRPSTQEPNTAAKVSPLEKMKHDAKATGGNQRRLTIFRMSRTMFFEKLSITRKVDFSAFVIYHFTYLLFNFIYWF